MIYICLDLYMYVPRPVDDVLMNEFMDALSTRTGSMLNVLLVPMPLKHIFSDFRDDNFYID